MPSLFARAGWLLRLLRRRPAPMDPAAAYDLWSATYDSQADNPLVAAGDQLAGELLAAIDLGGKVVVDVGCGTGRLWNLLLERAPARLLGYDVSEGMLARLRDKYPQAAAEKLDGYRLPGAPEAGCDLVISTLTLGYLADVDAALGEWSRVLRPGGDVVITDLHPDMAARGERSFVHEGRTMSIRHYVRPVAALEASAARHDLEKIRLHEPVVDDALRPIYERARAVDLFERTKGAPLLYGIHLRKRR